MAMYQDGSDRIASLSGANQGPLITSNNLLPLMDLRLLDSNDKPLASEVVPLAHSYHEAVLSALEAFPTHIKEGTKSSSITLKYPRKDLDGLYWAGIRSAIESPEVWISLCNRGQQIPTIGAILNEAEKVQPFRTDSVMYCFVDPPLKWASGTPPDTIAPLLTYDECISYYAQRISHSLYPLLRGEDLKKQITLSVNDGHNNNLPAGPSNYWTAVNTCINTHTKRSYGKRLAYVTLHAK